MTSHHIREVTRSGTFRVPAEATQFYIEVIGGGGSGGNGASGENLMGREIAYGGGGGGGGGSGGRIKLYLDVGSEINVGDTITYSVGTGGEQSQVTVNDYVIIANGGEKGENGSPNDIAKQGQPGQTYIETETPEEFETLMQRARLFGSQTYAGSPGSISGSGGNGGGNLSFRGGAGGVGAQRSFGQATPAGEGQVGESPGIGGGGGGGGLSELAPVGRSPHLPATSGAKGGLGAPGIIRFEW